MSITTFLKSGFGGLGLAGVVLLTACNDQPTEPGPAELVIVQAPSTVGAPGWELIDTLIVRAVDPSGTPRAGVGVTWAVRQGGGSVAATAGATDADGYAKAVWTLGATSGVNQVRASTLEGSQADFESTGEAFRAERLVSGWGIGCGLVDGAIWCWGDAFWGTGAPVSHNSEVFWQDLAPQQLSTASSFVDLSVDSDESVCGLDTQGAVWCASRTAGNMALIPGLPSIRRLAGGAGAHCGLAASDSTPWCWSPTGSAAQLAAVPALIGMWTDGWDGVTTRCGLRADSTAICWGQGPLGDGSTGSSDTPVVVSGNHRFVEMAVAVQLACGRTSALEVWCWGGDRDAPDLLAPALAITDAYSVATDYQHVQALQIGGHVQKWRGAVFGPPVETYGLMGLITARQADNNDLACLSLVDDQVYCYNEMFDGSSSVFGYDRYSPVQPVRPTP